MYESCYGLSEDPFRMSLDARFSFHHRSYVEVREYLEYGLSQGEGMLILLGKPGTGRSTIVNDLLVDHASTEVLVARLSTPPFAVDNLFQLLAQSLDVKTEGTDKGTILKSLENFLKDLHSSDHHALLIVDEAENIQEQGLEEMRLLTEIRQHNKPLIQILLQGHPKLLDVVQGSSIEPLRQLTLSTIQLNPMEFEETRAYVQHRLSVVGWHGDPEFSDSAMEVIHQFSAGLPRQVNMICNHILLYGCVEQIHRFDDHDVRQVIEELPPDMLAIKPVHAPGTRPPATTAKPLPEPHYNYHDRYSTSAKADLKDELKPATTRQTSPSISTATQENKIATLTATKANSGSDLKLNIQHSVHLNKLKKPTEPPNSRELGLGHFPIKPKQKRSANLDALSNHRIDILPSDLNAGAANAVARLGSHAIALPQQPAQFKQTHSRWRSRLNSLIATIILAAVLGGPYIYHILPLSEPDSLKGKDLNSPSPAYNNHAEPQRASRGDQSPLSTQPELEDWKKWQKMLSASALEALTQFSGLDDIQKRSVSEAKDPILTNEISPSSLTSSDKSHTQPTLYKPQGPDLQDDNSYVFSDTEIMDSATPETNSIPIEINDDKVDRANDTSQNPSNAASQESLNTWDRPLSLSKHGSHSVFTDSGIETMDGKLVINRRLENALRRYSRRVERLSGGALIITLQRGVVFEPDSINLNQTASETLDKLAFVLRNFDGFVLQIVIHTETHYLMGNSPSLSNQRAQTVANHLIARGIPATRVKFSKQNAHVTEHQNLDFTPQSNQRVEILVRPLV